MLMVRMFLLNSCGGVLGLEDLILGWGQKVAAEVTVWAAEMAVAWAL